MFKHLLERQMRVFWLIVILLWLFGFYWICLIFFCVAFTAQHDEETLEEEAEYDYEVLMSYFLDIDYSQNHEHQDIFLITYDEFYKKENGDKLKI